jgi:hypothetical protein
MNNIEATLSGSKKSQVFALISILKKGNKSSLWMNMGFKYYFQSSYYCSEPISDKQGDLSALIKMDASYIQFMKDTFFYLGDILSTVLHIPQR